jgi:hypothetical protein
LLGENICAEITADSGSTKLSEGRLNDITTQKMQVTSLKLKY